MSKIINPHQIAQMAAGRPPQNLPGHGPMQVPPELLQQAQVAMQRAMAQRQQESYQGPLSGDIMGEPVVMGEPGKAKEFMERLEALLREFHVHRLDVYWKGTAYFDEEKPSTSVEEKREMQFDRMTTEDGNGEE